MLKAAAVALLVSLAARAGEPAGLRAGAVDLDDPTARAAARRLQDVQQTAESRMAVLREAQREGAQHSGRSLLFAATRAAGNAWVNLGPDSASYEINGAQYTKVDSGRMQRVLVDPRDANIVYAATAGGGVWKTFNANAPVDASHGPTWQPITDGIGSLSIGSIAMDPANPDTLLLGLGDAFDVPMPGFLHSDDAGATWSAPVALTGSYPGGAALTATQVRDIRFGAAGSGVVLVAADVGVFRSTEGGIGSNWQLLDLDPAHAAQGGWSIASLGNRAWVVATQDANRVGHVWRSADDGASWSASALPASDAADVGRLTLAAVDASRVYLLAESVSAGNTKNLYRSDDGGATFGALALNATGKPTNPNSDQPDLDVLHGQAWYNQMLAVDPHNHDTVLVGGNLALVRSHDGGASWDVMTDWLPFFPSEDTAGEAYAHADWHAGTLANGVFYGGTDGGLFRSADVLTAPAGHATFEDRLNRGLVTHLVYSVACGNERTGGSNVVFGGLQDNGTRLRDPSVSTAFNQVVGGDGIGVGLGGSPVGSLLLATLPGGIRRSTDGGASFADATTGLPADLNNGANFYMRIATDFTDASAQTFLTLANSPVANTNPAQTLGRVFRTHDGAASWTDITGTVHLTTGATATTFPRMLNNLAANPLHAGQYVVTSAGGRAYFTVDGGANWQQTNPMWVAPGGAALLGGAFAVAFDSADASGKSLWLSSRAGVLTDGSALPAGVGHLFHSVDGGLTWASSSNGLPAVPISALKVDPNDAATIYAGTDLGLYRSIDHGASFTRFGTGLPLVSVTDVAVAMDGTSVRVATFGRGFWELYPRGDVPGGVHGNGDFDGDQRIDAFDLVHEATHYLGTSADTDYAPAGNLVGGTNAIDDADVTALLAKVGGRP